MSVFDAVEERLWLFMGLLQQGHGIYSWCYAADGTLYYTSCPKEKELQAMFELGGCLDYAKRQRGKKEPFSMSDAVGLMWFGEYFTTSKGDENMMIAGPVFPRKQDAASVQGKLAAYDISVQMKRSLFRIFEEIPVVDLRTLSGYGRMMHYAVTLEDTQGLGVSLQEEKEKGQDADWREKEADAPQSPVGNEENLLQYVRTGNRRYASAFSGLNEHGAMEEWQAKNPERKEKNQVVIFTSQCARAAVEGGLPPHQARRIEWKFMELAERQETLTGLIAVNKQMYETFIEKVAECQQYAGYSAPVASCMTYVKEHILEELTLEKIAKNIGYAPYYMSRRFYRETGTHLLDYIRKQRLEYAKIRLITTKKSIADICMELHFGGRRYFERIFKRETGMTPAEYRKRVKI